MPAAAHLAPTLARAPAPPAAAAGWLALSAALTEQIPPIAGRDDLIVTCAPGAGRGAPGCFLPDLASVELDGRHLGVDPATADPGRPSDRDRYPTLWGVMTHEGAHAAHTRWTPPPATAAAFADAALMSRNPGSRPRSSPAAPATGTGCAPPRPGSSSTTSPPPPPPPPGTPPKPPPC
jgi:hypothetical protein